MNYLAIGNQLNKEGKLEEAIIEYRQGINLNPHNAAIYRELGNTLSKQRKIDEAISCYQRVIEIQPLYQDYVKLAYLLGINRNLDKALTYLLKAIELKPNHYIVYTRLRRVRWESNQIERIIFCLKQVIQKNPDIIFPYLTLGHILTQQGNLDEAVKLLQKASHKNLSKSKPNFVKFDSSSGMKMRPDFMLIGAGKSGTTSLYEYLVQHPQVLPPLMKEIGFFNTPRLYSNGINWYLSHFPQIPEGENFLTGEATPSYLSHCNVAEKVFKLFPKVKLIVILRNPVDRTISAYHHSVKDNGELRSLEEVIDSEMKIIQEISDPSDAMKTKFQFPPKYILFSMYYYFLKKWINVFPREEFLILNSNDFYASPSTVMTQIFDFLDLPNYQLPNYPKYTVGSYSPINQELRTKLSDFFKPHNQKLEEYLDTKLKWD